MFAGIAAATSCVWTLIDLLVFGHFEGAIGDRWDNLELSVLICLAVVTLLAGGCHLAFALSRHPVLYLPHPVWLSVLAAVVSWSALYLFGRSVPFWSPVFDSWRVNVGAIVLFCVLLGGIVGRFLVAMSDRRRSAA